MRASESKSPRSASMRVVASRMRATKRAASSGSSRAPSASTSALARMAATGFFSSWERSAAKVSTKGRPSSWRRIESMARVRLCTSRPNVGGGAAWRSPRLQGPGDAPADEVGGERRGDPEADADDDDEGGHVLQRTADGDGALDDEHAP